MTDVTDQSEPDKPTHCVCGCYRKLEGGQTKYATNACKHRVRRQAKAGAAAPATDPEPRKAPPGSEHARTTPRVGENRRLSVMANPTPPHVPSHGNGLIGHAIPWQGPGDRRGRPSNEVRGRFRGVLGDVLDEVERRVAACRRPRPPKSVLLTMTAAELVDVLLEIDEWLEIDSGELRQLLDTCAKYGLGTKHVHAGDEDAEGVVTGIVILPAFNTEG